MQAFCKDREAAKRYFDEAVEFSKKRQYKEAISASLEAIKNDPEDSGNYFNMAIYYNNLGQKEEAIAALEKAETFAPDGSLFEVLINASSQEGTAKDMFLWMIGRMYRELGESNRAIRVINKSLESNKKAFAPYFQLGGIYFDSGMYNDAIQNLAKAVEINPNSGDAYFILGASQEKLGRREEAVNNFRKAIDVYKENNEKDGVRVVKGVLRNLGVK